jgi:hypothetical protein
MAIAEQTILAPYYLEQVAAQVQQEAVIKQEITYSREKKKHPGRAKLPENLPVEEIEIYLQGDLSDKVDEEVIKERVEALSSLADEMVSTRAQARIGETVRVLIEDAELQEGRAAHQGPEVDGSTTFIGTSFAVGEYVDAVVIDSMGADLVAQPL